MSITNRPRVAVVGSSAVLWRYAEHGQQIDLLPPTAEIDGQAVVLTGPLAETSADSLPHGAIEHHFEGPVTGHPDLRLQLIVRVVADNPVVRFRHRIFSTTTRCLTKGSGEDAVRLVGVTLPTPHATEVRLSDYNSLVHSYVPTEVPLAERDFSTRQVAMGPMITWPVGDGHAVLAYEHGSQHPDAYLAFQLGTTCGDAATADLVGVKGTYLQGHDLRNGWSSVWMELAWLPGDRANLEQAYREFILRYLAVSPASREPLIFYNTWNHQERIRHWEHRPYLADMNETRMLAEIDVAHRIGVDVFVIDTGWYDRTGDWRVDAGRFPSGMTPIRERLDANGMRLGLWFGPTSAAVSSDLLARNLVNRMSWQGERPPARSIWETEESEELCLVSAYADDFATELIRCARELGVTYFKWDAVSQYGCDDPHHDHGNDTNTPKERADSYAFQQPFALARIAEKITAAVPEAIVDFDVTEPQRCVGLAFLAAGKYFLVNNGPFTDSFDLPSDKDIRWSNTNLFFYPGAARDWVCRTPLTYDRWIPSVLFLTHYLPDDPASNQDMSIGSAILGQNGIWGDLLSISVSGVDRMARIIKAYQQVRDDVTISTAVRTGIPGGMIEAYEKINPATGRGVLVIFANQVGPPYGPHQPMVTTIVTASTVVRANVTTPGVEVAFDAVGRAVVTTGFTETGAAIVVFGACEPALAVMT